MAIRRALAHIMIVELVAANLQRLDSAAHGVDAQAPRSAQAFAKTNDTGECIDDAKLAGARGRRHEKPAIVGAKIKCGIKRI